MKKKKILLKLLMVTALLLTVLACSSVAKADNRNTRTVVDMTGKKVRIPYHIERVADLWHASNQVVLLLGGEHKLVATTQVIKQYCLFKLIYPEIRQVVAPFSGQTLQVEELLKTKPDVVIAADSNQLKQAKNAGLPVVNAMFQNFAGLRKSVDLTAKVLGGTTNNVAANYQKDLTANLNYVKSHLIIVKNKPIVLH
ncbi:MAG: peptide ABC transporter substrate-binding protein, partial [Liquorilactobacillus satsumensis]